MRVEYLQGLRAPTCRILRAFYMCTVECCYCVCSVVKSCAYVCESCVGVWVWVCGYVGVWMCGWVGGWVYVPQGKDKYANLIAGAPALVRTSRLNPAFQTAAAAGRGGG